MVKILKRHINGKRFKKNKFLPLDIKNKEQKRHKARKVIDH